MVRLGASRSFIAGGPTVVSEDVSDALASSTEVVRYAGSNRYETSADIATGQFLPTRGAFMATGENYPDALAAAAAAGREGEPLLLSRKTCLPNSGHKALKDLLVEDVTLVGGEAIVAPSTTPCDLKHSLLASKQRAAVVATCSPPSRVLEPSRSKGVPPSAGPRRTGP